MTTTGCATTQGTLRYSERFKDLVAPHHFRDAQGLRLSSLGIGTYLGNADEKTDRNYAEAIGRAVELGTNVIDTAANYRFQRSERSIGQALQLLTDERSFGRDEIVICTKGGYLPFDGAPPRDIRAYIEETFVKPGIATLNDIVSGSHCMTPAYLQHQLEQSLRNLRVACIDVYYIHNPETQLGFISTDEFYSRLRLAFAALQENVAAGKIKHYGVATWNGFRVPADSREYHSLPRMEQLAKEVGGESHGFRFIQLPYNLAMTEALTLENQTLGEAQVSVIEAAAALGITVVASASMLQGRVARGLPEDLREQLGSLATDAQTALQFVRSTPGITTALVGMSRLEHVEENGRLSRIEPLRQSDFMDLFAS